MSRDEARRANARMDVGGDLAQVELQEDRRDVLLNRLLAQAEVARDGVIAQAIGHEVGDAPLGGREPGEELASARGVVESVHHVTSKAGMEFEASARDLVDGGEHVRPRQRRATIEQGKALWLLLDERPERLRSRAAGQQDRLYLAATFPEGVQTLQVAELQLLQEPDEHILRAPAAEER